MHDWGDSGITAILLAIVVAVVFSFFVTRQARARAARKQDVRRRLLVAAEEARREEAEAQAEYTSMVAVAYPNRCAICSNPTPTRCSRCKAVHYCSLPCQRQHWKEGHKQHCRAPEAVTPIRQASLSNGSTNFTDIFSNGSFGSGSKTLSGVSDGLRRDVSDELHKHGSDGVRGGVFDGLRGEDIAPADSSRTAPSTRNGILAKPKKILFPYEIFEKFFNSEGIQSSPCGLINCGNSCFANVVLQCLTYTRPLTSYLLEGIHSEECRRNDWCFMCELQEHIWRIKQNHNPVSPISIISHIRNIGNHLGYGRQEDAHEFMRFAIDSMQSICLDEAGGEKSVDTPTQETTFIYHIFGGHLQSQVKCMRCLHESNRYENMMDLAVEIQGCVETLEDALAQFTATEVLDGENKYKCDRCNAYVKARKQLTVHEAPNVLTIALKRFQTGKFGKLNKRVTFPEVLDIMPYMSGKGDKPPLYRLYAVVVHVDMLNASFFGHYICYVKDSEGLWYKIDDSKVKEVDLEKVMAQRAYMLFYRRSSARPPPVTVGVTTIHTGVQFPETEELSSDRHGGLKVYPSPPGHLHSGEAHTSHDTSDYQSEVDFNQMQADNDETLKTVQHSLSTNEVHPKYRSWEMERILPPSDNEILPEEYSGCVSNGSSISMTSPCISSFRSNPGLWVPSKSFVCEVPNTLGAEGTEFVSVGHPDFSDVSLQTGALDKPGFAKAVKRRLEESVCSLPAPKFLDSDQPPAWPSIDPESHDSDQSGQSVPSALYGVCGDELCKAFGEELGQEDLVRTCSTALKPIGEEELVARAKRQHLEIDTSVEPKIANQPADESNAVGHLSRSELGERDMDWDDSRQQGASVSVCTASDPVMKCVEPTSSELEKGSSLNGMQASTSERQVILTDMTIRSLPIQADEASANLSSFELGPGALVGRSCQGTTVQESMTTLQSSSKSDNNQVGSLEDMLVGYNHNLNSESLLPSGATVESTGCILESSAAGIAGDVADANQVVVQPGMDHTVQNSLRDTVAKLDRLASKETTAAEEAQVPIQDLPSDSVQRRLQKKRSPSKPLFAPGFLNKVRAPLSESVAKAKRAQISRKPSAMDVNGQLNKIEEPVRNVVLNPCEPGELCLPNGTVNMATDRIATISENGHASNSVDDLFPSGTNGLAQGSGNGHAFPAANCVKPSCQNCTNCELCTSAHLHDKCKAAGNGVCNKQEKKISKIETGAINGGVVNSPGHTDVVTLRVSDEDHSMEQVGDAVVPSGRPVIGKQKQGRNETCNCGSQRKWKKCCGKAGMLKPEPGRRRLVV